MDARDRSLVLGEARKWAQEGLLPAGSLARIESMYAAPAGDEGRSTTGTTLAGLGGLLLGAAAIALSFLLDLTREDTSVLLLAWGAAMAVAAEALARAMRQAMLADGVRAGALFTLGAAALAGGEEGWMGAVAACAGVAALLYRPSGWVAPLLAPLAYAAGIAGMLLGLAHRHPRFDEEGASALFLAAALAYLGFTLALDRLRRPAWGEVVAGDAALAAVGGWVFFTLAVLEPGQGMAELIVGAFLGALLGAGVALRERGLIVVSALLLALDAIVLAFDLGGAWGGFVAILAVAAAALAGGKAAVRYLKEG